MENYSVPFIFFPGLATAEKLRLRGHDIVLWLAGKDVEADALKDWEGPRHTVKSQGFQSKSPVEITRTVYSLNRATAQCRRLMRKDKPDVILAMGSYASVGPVKAALRLKVPVVLHEANVVPGRTVSHFAARATVVAACFEESRFHLQNADLVITGMPLRDGLERLGASSVYRPPEAGEPFTILVTGGSRGASALNLRVAQSAVGLKARGINFRIIHLTGRADQEAMQEHYDHAGIDARVEAFVNDMSAVYRQTHFAISRAGAATCAELSAFGIPSLLVPYPYAVRDHQTSNALAMEKSRAADFIPESDLDSVWLEKYMHACIQSPERLMRLSDAARARRGGSAAAALAMLVESVAHGRVVA